MQVPSFVFFLFFFERGKNECKIRRGSGAENDLPAKKGLLKNHSWRGYHLQIENHVAMDKADDPVEILFPSWNKMIYEPEIRPGIPAVKKKGSAAYSPSR